MKIGIFADIEVGRVGGIQQYIEKLFIELIKQPDIHLLVITNQVFFVSFFKRFEKYPGNFEFLVLGKKQRIFSKLIYSKLLRSTILDKIINSFLFSHLSEKLGNIKPLIQSRNLDLLHFPFQVLPIENWNIPTCLTLHDIQHVHFPHFFSSTQIIYRKFFYSRALKKADHIIVSFPHVKEDIIEKLNIPQDKISCTSLGIEDGLKRVNPTPFKILKEKFGLKENYLFYPAQTWKHKNHLRLIEAIKILRDEKKVNISLICSGKKNEYFSKIQEKIREQELSEFIKFVGFLDMEDLVAFYLNAGLVVIPTLYEAGSFPLFEALGLATPVICSNVTSLPDTIGDERFIFDPWSSQKIAEKIFEIYNSPEMKLQSRLNGQKRSKELTWDRCIPNFISAYQKTILAWENKSVQN